MDRGRESDKMQTHVSTLKKEKRVEGERATLRVGEKDDYPLEKGGTSGIDGCSDILRVRRDWVGGDCSCVTRERT